MKNFNELPASIKNEVKNLLKVYDKCFVTYENAAYHVSPSIAIIRRVMRLRGFRSPS